MVMDFAQGGDFFALLRRFGRLREHAARVCVAARAPRRAPLPPESLPLSESETTHAGSLPSLAFLAGTSPRSRSRSTTCTRTA